MIEGSLSDDDDYREVSAILDGQRYRRILAILLDCPQPVTVAALARQLKQQVTDSPQISIDQIRTDLHHRCLPKLVSVDWIKRRADGITVTESCPFEEFPDDPPERFWDAVSTVYAQPRRRAILSFVAQQDETLTLDAVVTGLRECNDISKDTTESALLTVLHHIDLPKLASVGLLAYDSKQQSLSRTEFLETFLEISASGVKPIS